LLAGEELSLTPWGKKIMDSRQSKDDPEANCLPTGIPRIAPYLGEITLKPKNGEPTTVAMLQGLVENEGDGWQWTLDELSRFYESVATLPAPQELGASPAFIAEYETPSLAREHAALDLDAAALLGRRTAEMHLALATPTQNSAFIPESFTTADLVAWESSAERAAILATGEPLVGYSVERIFA
jgi:predicted trehalose synthase